MPNNFKGPRASAALLLALGSLLAGGSCRDEALPLPAVYPVTGEIRGPGGIPMEGATVEFTPVGSSSEHMASGSVNAEGQFKLRMSHRRGMIDGAPEGSYTLAVYMPLGSHRSGERIQIDGRFTVEPRENNFTIQLPITR